jgi:micrococcal nuclease
MISSKPIIELRVIAFLLLIYPCICYPQLKGKVVSIADGDTFTMLVKKNQIRVRLHGIDCPEKTQDYGMVAKKYLSDLIFGKEVIVIKKGIDRYGRTIGMVTIDGASVNESLLREGLAWHYTYYDKNVRWAKLEANAKEAKKGLWIKRNAIPPWDFRKVK